MTEERDQRREDVASRIREARAKAGLTQAEVARLLGVSAHTVWSWEGGRVRPNQEHLVELARHCGVSTDWLLGRDVIEAEVLKEMNVSFRQAVAGLPIEDIESIWEFIQFVRERRRKGMPLR